MQLSPKPTSVLRYFPKPGLWLFLAVLAALFAPSGCSSDADAEPPCEPTLQSIRENVFDESCTAAGCHSGGDEAAAGMDLRAADLEAELVNAPAGTCDGIRVVPGDPEASFLWQKLYSETPACGAPMPVGGHLPATKLSCIRDWIASLPAADAGPGCETCGSEACVDLATDSAHCGACAAACPPGSSCQNADCVCSGGLTACGTGCVDVQSDTGHCGACDTPCPAGALCSAGHCVCPGALEVCGDACVDKQSDPGNCGSCSNTCSPGQFCLLGVCGSDCGSLEACGSSCVDTVTSPFNCGGCGIACPSGASCVGGTCVCPAGTSACNGSCINTESDPNNCGGCGTTCSGALACEGGQCRCPGGGTPCGSGCVDTATDPDNCGGCGVVCGGGQTCESGVCTCGSGASVSFSGDVQPIFTRSCAIIGCHAGVRAQEGLNLAAGNAYGNIVNVASRQCTSKMRVLPGDPSQSYLMNKLMGVSLCFGTQMPKSGTSLPRAQIDTIGAWICSGAPNN